MQGPSTTARLVAAARLRAPRLPFVGGRPEEDERLARDVAGDLIDRPTPLQRHLEARTAFVDGVLVAALDAGVSQVVLAAAGYDGRALRYARPGVRWFELDHPATQADKCERLGRLGIATAHVAFVPADFTTDPVAERLAAAGSDPAARSVVVCEGLAIYLEPPVLARLLGELARATGPESTLLVTASSAATDAATEERRARLGAAVAALGEPMLSRLSGADLDVLFLRSGWVPMQDQRPDARARGFLLATREGGPSPRG